jgi:hypothetical protein
MMVLGSKGCGRAAGAEHATGGEPRAVPALQEIPAIFTEVRRGWRYAETDYRLAYSSSRSNLKLTNS